VITSTKNRQVAAAARLKKRGLRERSGAFLVEGAQATAEALAAGAVETLFHVPGASGRVPTVVAEASGAGVPVVAVGEAVMAHLTSAVTPQGIVAVARFVDVGLDALPGDPGMIPVLCSVRDPGNAGTILRSADASGASAVVFSAASVDVYNSKTVRASAGSLFHLPVVRDVAVEEAVAALRARGAQVLAAVPDGESAMYDVDLTGPTAVLFGNEAWGLEPEVRRLADRTVRVPIAGRSESLNLAAAAALILFEAARPRGGAGEGRRAGSGDLASVLSASAHDMRLPLTAVKGFASTLAERWDDFEDAERRQMVEGMALDTERTGAMVTMIVDAARLEAGRFRVEPRRLDLAEAASWVASLFSRGANYPTVEVRGGAEVSADRERLRAILLAMCDGALWWGREGPVVIEIRSDAVGGTVEVRREVGGPTPEELEAMFEGPQVRGGKIGLHIARRIAEAHGWTLVAEGGDEIRFVLTLPA
jgi:TrmH family RNA methyltransferase